MTILDLIALRQAIASSHVDPEYTDETDSPPRWRCHTGPLCEDCALDKQCDKWTDADIWYTECKTLPDFDLSLDELQSKYPELFI